jgi:phage tail-like protein
MADTETSGAFVPFRFVVSLYSETDTSESPICSGAFSEVSGFEFTMTPKSIQEGGRNWGEVQLVGNTKFSAITLKRGITRVNDLYKWFDVSTRQANYAFRMTGYIDVYDQEYVDKSDVQPVLRWQVIKAMATKFKGPDLSSTSSQVAIEELQLMHEGLKLLTEGNPS